MPSPCNLIQQRAERFLLLVAQAGGRLVEHQQRRVGRERARHLEHALRAQRQVAGQLVRAPAQADAFELRTRFGQQRRFSPAVEAQAAVITPARRARARRWPRCRAGSSAAASFSCPKARASAAGRAPRWDSRRPRRGGETPRGPARYWHGAGQQVEHRRLPAPFGPIRPTILPARTSKLTLFTATRPPKRLSTPCTESTGAPRGWHGAPRQRLGGLPRAPCTGRSAPRFRAPCRPARTCMLSRRHRARGAAPK